MLFRSLKDDPDRYLRVDEETGELVNLTPEFSRMSLRPAIGKRWIEKYWREVYPLDRVVVDGREFKPPRYYDKWLEDNEPEMAMEVRAKRISEAKELSRYTLDAKESIHKSRMALFGQRNKV